jgi:membrane-bound ClpP family serine protease
MKRFLSNVTASEVLQALLALLLWGTICYLYLTGQAVPDTLLGAGSIVLGFYFHSAAQTAALKLKG